jgi:hypothetical protein
MAALFRPVLRWSAALALLAVQASCAFAQTSMMLRNNNAPAGGVAVNQGDFDNDGILDVVAANADGSVSVYAGRSDGTFGPPVTTSTGNQPDDFVIADFNNDGKLDLAVANIVSNTIQILLGNGDGTFRPAESILIDAAANSITASDFNNDGKIDLAIAVTTFVNQNAQSKIEILRGDGTGHFSLVNTFNLPPAGFFTKVRVGDFNGDGKVDLAVLQQQALSVWFGNGNFTFDPLPLASYTITVDLTTADVNQDGFSDILVSFISDFLSFKGGVDGFFGTAGRRLTRRSLIAPSNSFEAPGQLIAADVNGDGINDIAALDMDSTVVDGLFVWIGNPDGTYQQTPMRFPYTTDRDKTALVAGDFNRDGKIDFAAAEGSAISMEVLSNATPRAPCQSNTADPSMTVCQPRDGTFSNSPLRIVAQAKSSHGVTGVNVYVDNVLQGRFPGPSIDEFFPLSSGQHFLVVKGFDATGASFRSDRHVTIFAGAPGETCATPSQVLTITVCAPAQSVTLHSPVQIFANAYSPRLVTAIQVYIDNQLEFNDTTATEVNKLFSMSPGLHFIEVKAWDADGHQVTESRTIDVH